MAWPRRGLTRHGASTSRCINERPASCGAQCGGTNELSNLRTLCRRCHVLRADHTHQGMVAQALRDGIIPPNWRALVWDDAPANADDEAHLPGES